ncbi:hypothetical protein MNB_SV-4-1291 [hydrothermal vent metagenome]|uniref:Uncharacterized protein n=1 Tax=hydrothermal vent metagenome TaxID=652676 RepID=A0A1W1E883_9ZZZZ
MTKRQLEIFEAKQEEWISALELIGGLDIPEEWREIFTTMCLNRCFRRVDHAHLGKMLNIATVNSKSVKFLSIQDKKAGLETLEDLSVKIKDEHERAKAVEVILGKGIKQSRKEIDLIIAMANSTPSLFDMERQP